METGSGDEKKKWSKRERRKERELFTICQGLSDSIWASPVAQQAKNPPGMQETQETQVQPLGRKDPPEEEMATHARYSCLKNPMDRGAWQATVHRVTKSWTWLSD